MSGHLAKRVAGFGTPVFTEMGEPAIRHRAIRSLAWSGIVLTRLSERQ